MRSGSARARLSRARSRLARPARGFTYIAVLFSVAVIGFGLSRAAVLWSTERQREREAELIWTGKQIAQAIGLYYQRTPGTAKRYPEKLEDLLEDRRYLTMQRYLRRLYPDPLTGRPEWGLIPAPEGGIQRVYSLSEQTPVRRTDPNAPTDAPVATSSYREWRFTYTPPAPPQAPARR